MWDGRTKSLRTREWKDMSSMQVEALGPRTCCISCNMVWGQFFGIVYTWHTGRMYWKQSKPIYQNQYRFVQFVEEYCSLWGWPPTSTLYRKIANLGFKSVVHYLSQTRRAQITTRKKKTQLGKKQFLQRGHCPFFGFFMNWAYSCPKRAPKWADALWKEFWNFCKESWVQREEHQMLLRRVNYTS